jgi:hypothetical protein
MPRKKAKNGLRSNAGMISRERLTSRGASALRFARTTAALRQ